MRNLIHLEVEMKMKLFRSIVTTLLLFSFAIGSWAATTVPKQKQAYLGLYVTAKEAFTKWHANQDDIYILDVRTPGEYIFVGHAPMASNIPLKFLERKPDPKKMKPMLFLNTKFVDQVKDKFNKTDVIMIMCRSGSRSAVAVNKLAKAGFTNVYNITDGFEGDTLKLPRSYNNGQRIINGWRNSGAPWTYNLDQDLLYVP